MARVAQVLRFPIKSPDDVSSIAEALDGGQLDVNSIVSILGKVEGNGCVNDFTRGYATQSLALLLSKRLKIPVEEVEKRVVLCMSGGTEGALCPHFIVFSVANSSEIPVSQAPGEKRLAIGVSFTPQILPEDLGRVSQVEATSKAVLAAMAECGISDPADVHYVQVKCPLLTKERIAKAQSRGATVVTTSTYSSMAYSRGASALGIALALGEVAPEKVTDDAICKDWSLFSGRASASAGIELLHNEVMVLGNSTSWGGDLQVKHDVMQDAIDSEAARRALSELGISASGQLGQQDRDRVAAVLCKAEASVSGTVRGRRHIMLDDSDIQATRHARAVVGGVLAGVFGETCLFVSGGAEHQGPDGGGPIAVIGRI